jgi:hypothetical protein
MEHQPRIVVIGHSLLMEGVAVSLANTPMGNIIWADPVATDTEGYLQALQPDLVILELCDPRTARMLSLLKTNPNVLFLGLNENCNQAFLLKSHECAVHTIQDLLEILHKALGWKFRLLEGGEHSKSVREFDV